MTVSYISKGHVTMKRVFNLVITETQALKINWSRSFSN
jgi:hypothetical protein